MESTESSTGACTHQPNLPPGFRFHPTDEELVVHYLKKKASSAPLPVAIIADVDLYKFDPWELPAKATFGEQEWYFFSPRERKYPNGARPNRAATSGYWKATGTDKPVLTSNGAQKVGVKKALVFYGGKPPKGIKTNWIMHEYRLAENKVNNKPPGCDFGSKKNSLRLDDWVLCRIYKKNNNNMPIDHEREESTLEDHMIGSIPPSIMIDNCQKTSTGFHQLSRAGTCYGGLSLLENGQDLLEAGFMNINDPNSVTNFPSSSTSKPDQFPFLPTKRSHPMGYWMDEDATGGSSSKRFNGENGDGNESIATLLSQLPPTPPSSHQTQAVLGSLPYQLQGMSSWYS